jgi:hypothetical protein
LIGCGFAASAKYLGLLWRIIHARLATGVSEVQLSSVLIFTLALFASLALVCVGYLVAQPNGSHSTRNQSKQEPRAPRSVPAALLVGAALLVAGSFVAYNSTIGRTILPVAPSNEGSLGIDPVGVALAFALLGVLLLVVIDLPLPLVAGIGLALGLETFTIWIRYVGIPLAEQRGGNGAVGLGGVLGFAGAVLVLSAMIVWLASPRVSPIRSDQSHGGASSSR